LPLILQGDITRKGVECPPALSKEVSVSFHEAIKDVKRAVVGLGLLADPQDPLSVVIQGTGFVVHPEGWIMTNRHVAELFFGEREGVYGVRNAIARAVVFVETLKPIPGTAGQPALHHGLAPCPVLEVAMPPIEKESGGFHYNMVPDLAVCRIGIQDFDFLRNLPSLRLADSSKVREGDEVAVCGFPMGLTLPRDEYLNQMTPVVQKGIVAAILPWSGVTNPHAFQLDIQINPGSSGSPVFLPDTGEVVGVVFAAPVRPVRVDAPDQGGEQEVATVRLPTGFGYAVPSNRYREQPPPVTRLPDVYRHSPRPQEPE
jgi:S1-C subfamily serine protease